MSCTRTTPKELRALILRLDAALNDFGSLEEDKREAIEDLALTAKDIMEENNECDAETAARLDEKAVKLWQDGDSRGTQDIGDVEVEKETKK